VQIGPSQELQRDSVPQAKAWPQMVQTSFESQSSHHACRAG